MDSPAAGIGSVQTGPVDGRTTPTPKCAARQAESHPRVDSTGAQATMVARYANTAPSARAAHAHRTCVHAPRLILLYAARHAQTCSLTRKIAAGAARLAATAWCAKTPRADALAIWLNAMASVWT